MFTFFKYSLITIIGIYSLGCAYYAPTAHNIPLFQKKNELRVGGGVSLSAPLDEEVFSADLYGAYAITNQIGLLTNTNIFWGSNTEDEGKGFLIEVGGGYFKLFHQRWVFELYGLLGHGYQTHDYTTAGSATINALKYSIQPSLGFTSKYFDAAFSTRLVLLHFYHYSPTDFASMDADVADDLTYLDNHRISFLFEPALMLRGGWDHLKLQLQAGSSLNANNADLAQTNFFFHLGVITLWGK